MTNKCNGCGKFRSEVNSIVCVKCSDSFHRQCAVNIATDSTSSPKWACKTCKNKLPAMCRKVSPNNDTHRVPSSATTSQSNVSAREEDDDGSLRFAIKQLHAQLLAVTQEISSFREEFSSVRSSINEVNNRVDSLESRLENLEVKTSNGVIEDSDLHDSLAQLRMELNESKQSSLSNDIIISVIPERREENLGHIVSLIATKLGNTLDDRSIIFAERIGMIQQANGNTNGDTITQKPRLIAVRLSHRAVREQLIRSARIRRGADTADLGIDSEPKRFYINERLTRENNGLFQSARERGSEKGWRYVWTREGRIYARKSPGSLAHRIRTELDLNRIFG